uniref:Putative sensor histidine kinase/response regulator FphA n=1 Tax=Aspergillus glaucus TaxID=41413 RepID=A0A1S5P8X0_ASPGL|nr:putative sensor histidine kinase/response regulator FphA [Aspergillus glaucus]
MTSPKKAGVNEAPPDQSPNRLTPPTQPTLQRENSFDGTDIVYPIRSVVSVDPTSQNSEPVPSHPASPIRDGVRRYSIIDANTWDQMQSRARTDSVNDPPKPINATENPDLDEPEYQRRSSEATEESLPVINPEHPQNPEILEGTSLVTSRFEHVITERGHAVATGPGAPFQPCEDEPIHIPGAVQSFGVLVVIREEAGDQYLVRIASENSKDLLGYSPNELFALQNFCDILRDDQADDLLDHIDFIRDDSFDPSVDGPEVFLLSIKQPSRRSRKFWCAIHRCPADPSLIICEFELEDDQINPLNVSGRGSPASPSATLGLAPTPEQLAASTSSMSQPLRTLRNARRRRGEAAAMEVFSILTQIQDQLARTETLESLLNTATGLVKELTGFHRVLIYQFDLNWNGTVVAELVDPRASVDLYKGLHFPAMDIPRQARDLYRVNKVRLLYDRDQTTSRLVCRTAKDLETPLDMTHAYLRAMSPIHIKYLANMEIRASMSISINGFNELWGLISCHSYGKSGMRVSFPIRKMCRLVGDSVSRNIERLSYSTRLQARKLINTAPTDANPSGYIIASSDDLLKLFGADYGALCIRDETKLLGKLTHSQEILALLEYLKLRQINSVLASHHVTKDFPDLRYPPGFKHISGLLYVPLSTGGTDFMVFFRRRRLTEIKWAGNPYDKKVVDGYLQPRKSFQTWCETILDQSREWTETDVETAAVLCLVYGKFIKVWRQKEAAMENSQLTQLLLANSAHEVRTPLNAIINYLEIAMEGSLDTETRDNLTKSYSASKSLIYVINDLLDLTNIEKGQNLIKDESFDLPQTIKQAAEMFEGEAKRKGISFNVHSHPGLPTAVVGDQRRIRQVISNLISNAMQHTSTGGITVEVWRAPSQPDNSDVMIEMVVVDTGSGMSQDTLEALFQQLEQVGSMDDEEGQDHLPSLEGQEKRVLGLGLALVARIVRNLQGQLGVRSKEGKGSRFKISLQFPVPEGTTSTADSDPRPPSRMAETTAPFQHQQEIMLVDRNRSLDRSRRQSAESNRSGQSGSSAQSNRSEADRLISAMQEPLLVRSASEGGATRTQQLDANDPLIPKPRKTTSSSVAATPTTEFAPGPDIRTTVPPVSNMPPGQTTVKDFGVPLGAIRVPEQDVERPPSPPKLVDGEPAPALGSPEKVPDKAPQQKAAVADRFNVLVAEDDPINSKIIQKRLEKLGHKVHLTPNGEACAGAYRADCKNFDIVLMDIQVCFAPSQLTT